MSHKSFNQSVPAWVLEQRLGQANHVCILFMNRVFPFKFLAKKGIFICGNGGLCSGYHGLKHTFFAVSVVLYMYTSISKRKWKHFIPT